MMDSELADNLIYPLFARPKIGGVYCRIVSGVPHTKHGERVRNRIICDILSGLPPFEGRLVVGDEVYGDDAHTRDVASDPDAAERFVFWAYDIVTRANLPFNQRLPILEDWVRTAGPRVGIVGYNLVRSSSVLLALEAQAESSGALGIITYQPDSLYEKPSFTTN